MRGGQALPVIVFSEHIRAPASQHGEHPGSQVARRVDRVSAVVAETESDTQDSEAHGHRDQLANGSRSYYLISQWEASFTCFSSFMLRGSVMAQMQRSSNIVPRNWSNAPPAMERCGLG